VEKTAQQSRPAEQVMTQRLSPEHLKLEANWLREELSVFEKEYAQGGKHVQFVATRLTVIAQNTPN